MPTESFNALLTALGNFSGLGVFAALFVWREMRSDAARLKMEQDKYADQARHEEKRLAFDRERLEADKALAGALAALTGAVNSRRPGR